ncbi:MAG: helix-turn-helix domain-containing protein [Acidobacteriota bacterium]
MKAKVKYLRGREIAHILDCSPDDVLDMARKGTLKAVKEGRFWWFREADVMAYKKRMEVTGKGKAAKK